MRCHSNCLFGSELLFLSEKKDCLVSIGKIVQKFFRLVPNVCAFYCHWWVREVSLGEKIDIHIGLSWHKMSLIRRE